MCSGWREGRDLLGEASSGCSGAFASRLRSLETSVSLNLLFFFFFNSNCPPAKLSPLLSITPLPQ